MTHPLRAHELSKSFTLHAQGGTRLPVFEGVDLTVEAGECVCLDGPSGTGKSTLLRSLYANYRVDQGQVLVEHASQTINLMAAEPWQIIEVRRHSVGHVSQFLRVIPRVPTLDVVAEPARLTGRSSEAARASARQILERLGIPPRLWALAPATFSGGEQQRVNVARGFVVDYPILLLDEPTASLDAENRATVIELIREAKKRGAAVIGIMHDLAARAAVADRLLDMTAFTPRAARPEPGCGGLTV